MNSPFTDFVSPVTTEELPDTPVKEIDFETPFDAAEFLNSDNEHHLETDEIDLEMGRSDSESTMVEEHHFTESYTDDALTLMNETEEYISDESEIGAEEEISAYEQYVETEVQSKGPAFDFNLVSVERDKIGTTIYINPDLKIKNTVNLTGIFIPCSFVASDDFELIIYLHGYKFDTSKGPQACYKDICPSTTIQTYWKSSMFLLREALCDSGRQSILVAPTLGLKSEAGILQLDRGFDLLINHVLRALIIEKKIEASYRPCRVVLAAHSGGGLSMQRITMLNDSYSRLIKECWCFDSLYGDVSGYWSRWIKADGERKFYTYYLGAGPTRESREIEQSCKDKPGRCVAVPSRVHNHWNLVLPYWKERCSSSKRNDQVKLETADQFYPEAELDEWIAIENEIANIAPDNPASKYHSSKLPADKDPNIDLFKRKVYERCIRASKAAAFNESRTFLDDLPDYTSFPKIDGQWIHPAMLQSLQRLIKEAINAANARGDSIQIKVASGYRPTSLQFARWNSLFYKYYDRAVNGYTIMVKGQKKQVKPFIGKNDFSDKAIQDLGYYIRGLYGSPGYSNHNSGKAIDFAVSGKELRKNKIHTFYLGPNSSQLASWRETNFWHWLKENAALFEFEEYSKEPWHWNFVGGKLEEYEIGDSEIDFEEEIIFPETEEPLTIQELLEEGVFQYQTQPKPKKRSIFLGKNDPPLYYVGIDVTDTVDTVAFGHLWNQKFGWKNLLWELGKDPKNNQRRIDKAHPKLPIVRLIRKHEGVTYADTCLIPQGVDGKGVDKLWSGTTSSSNSSDINAACTFMQSFILNPSADKSTSSLNDSGTGVTADIVYISSHGLSTGDMFGEVFFADSVFALTKSVSLGAQFSGVGWLLLSNCSTLKPYTHEDWLKLMSGPVPLRGIVGFQDTCPLASGSVKVFQSFIKRLAEDKTFIESWSEALKVRGLEDHWIVVCQEDAVKDKIADYNARTLTQVRPGGKVLMFNKANPGGVQVVPVPDPFEVFWTKGGTKVVPANRGIASNKLAVGDKVSITVRPPTGSSTFSNGSKISVTLVYVRINHPQAIDVTKIFKVIGSSGVSSPTAADLNPQNPPGPDSWEMVVSGSQKEIILHLECKDLTDLHSNYIFWLEVTIPGRTHEFVHNGSIAIS